MIDSKRPFAACDKLTPAARVLVSQNCVSHDSRRTSCQSGHRRRDSQSVAGRTRADPSAFRQEGVPIESVGVTDEHRFPTRESRRAILREIIANAPADGEFNSRYWQAWLDPGSWHAAWKLPSGQANIVQTGVMVLSPKHHREILEHVYHAYEDRGLNYEMRPLSHEIQSHGLQHWIDPRFNALVWWMFLQYSMGGAQITTQAEMHHFLLESYRRSYFLHFAGAANLMPLLCFVRG